MRTTVTVDKAGRIVLPKPIRDAFRIGPGDTLELETETDRMVLQPVRVRPGLLKERGIWIFRSGTPVDRSMAELIDGQRGRQIEGLQGDRG